MRKKYVYLVLFICSFILISCKDKKVEKRIESLKFLISNTLGEKLIIPDSLYLYKPYSNSFADSLKIATSELKIYSQINTSCGTCINKIHLWSKLAEEIKAHNISIILVCESDDNFKLIQHFYETTKVENYQYSLFFNRKNNFSELNNFMKKSDNFKTVLTDKNNNIVLIGNPIESKKMEELYLEEILKRTEN